MPRVPSKPGDSPPAAAAKRARPRKPAIPADSAAGTPPDDKPTAAADDSALALFHPITRAWFRAVFDSPAGDALDAALDAAASSPAGPARPADAGRRPGATGRRATACRRTS